MVSAWMWRLATMVSMYDEEAVTVDQLLGGGLLLIKELTGGQGTTTRGGGLLLGSFNSDDQALSR
jgi:hypothetical protein